MLLENIYIYMVTILSYYVDVNSCQNLDLYPLILQSHQPKTIWIF